jgi:hypothetical protein
VDSLIAMSEETSIERPAPLLASPDRRPGPSPPGRLPHDVLVPNAAELGIDLGTRGQEPLNNQPLLPTSTRPAATDGSQPSSWTPASRLASRTRWWPPTPPPAAWPSSRTTASTPRGSRGLAWKIGSGGEFDRPIDGQCPPEPGLVAASGDGIPCSGIQGNRAAGAGNGSSPSRDAGAIAPNPAEFPVFSLLNRDSAPRDGFALECTHRQPVWGCRDSTPATRDHPRNSRALAESWEPGPAESEPETASSGVCTHYSSARSFHLISRDQG